MARRHFATMYPLHKEIFQSIAPHFYAVPEMRPQHGSTSVRHFLHIYGYKIADLRVVPY